MSQHPAPPLAPAQSAQLSPTSSWMLGARGKAFLPFLLPISTAPEMWPKSVARGRGTADPSSASLLNCAGSDRVGLCFSADMFEYPLNFQEIAETISFRVPIVERCIHETLLFFAEAIRGKKEVDFFFKRLGILSLRGQEVIMNFFDDCVLQLDATGNMLPALLGVSLHASWAPCSALK